MKKLLFLLIPVLMFSYEKDSLDTEALGENASIIGTLSYQMRIVSLEEDRLGIRYLFSKDRVEAR